MKATNSRSSLSATVMMLAGFALTACGAQSAPTAQSARQMGGIFGGEEEQPSISVAGEEPAPEIVETEVSATFDASASGSVCSSGVVFDGQPPQPIGEIGEDYGPNYAPNTESCTGFWTFSLLGLPSNATVTAATFAPGECHSFNDPFKGNSTLQFDGVDVGPTLDTGDIPYFSQANLGNWANCPFPMDVTAYVQSRVAAGASSIQFGAYMTFPQYGDGQEANVWFANDAWNVPTLTIRYY